MLKPHDVVRMWIADRGMEGGLVHKIMWRVDQKTRRTEFKILTTQGTAFKGVVEYDETYDIDEDYYDKKWMKLWKDEEQGHKRFAYRGDY